MKRHRRRPSPKPRTSPDALERLHPAPGLRQQAAQRGHETEKQEGQRQAEAEAGEDGEAADRGQGQGRAQCGAHEGAGAGRRHEGGEHSGEKGAAQALGASQPVPRRDHRKLEQAGKAEGNGGDQQQQQQDHARILKLEGPAGRGAARPQGQQQPAQREAGRDHAGRISQRLVPGAACGFAGAGEAQRLQAQDREDAGHDVEDQPAEHRAE